MLIEHILYSLSVAIIVSIIFDRYYTQHSLSKINPAWLILLTCFLPDVDYIIQKLCYAYNDICGVLTPIMITHGDFHNFFMFIILSVVVGIITVSRIPFIYGFACAFIGCLVHFFCDLMVYKVVYYPFVPFNYGIVVGFDWMHESLNMFGVGDWNIFIIGICIVIYTFMVRSALKE